MPRKNDDDGEHQPEGSQQRKNRVLREDANQRSMESHRSTRSTDSDNNIMDMVASEKAAAMDPIKSRNMSISIYDRGNNGVSPAVTFESDDLEAQDGEDQERAENDDAERTMMPGAYRMASGQVQIPSGGSVATPSVYSEGSESCVVVIPQAALVDEHKDEERGNDMEGQIKEIPIVVAERSEAFTTLESAPRGAGLRKNKIFKISLLVCLTLVALLLGGVLYLLLTPENSNSNSLEDDSGDGGGGGGPKKRPPKDDGGNRLF